jgi:orotate phosphoribosyltransferase
MGMKQKLIEIICEKSFKYTKEPSFKLVSGRMSQFYVNCKPTTLSPRGMFLVGHLVFENIKDLKPDGIGGLTFGADPMAMATAFVSELKGRPINAFSIRKTQKDHGSPDSGWSSLTMLQPPAGPPSRPSNGPVRRG